ncbi:MAG: MerR family transcriptional regulator [Ornithinimicrobium sp.]|uniref:MerR family transcriptional regulator n=1 Tax=Ornithinimicrobium sp. TaxID=1977084 RepID=UPI0026DEEC24|nr:MerR family transcriptional regulator [Ornithinimicrobium sp.]MDO5740431.1 MerR family transcriptional regulator [Ornithinimicrobium sp.]
MVAIEGPQYTVKQVAQIVGVSPATVRAWERRYGVVSPKRSESSYRLYDDEDVARLSRMGLLVRAGRPASLAAAQVLGEAATPAASPSGAALAALPTDQTQVDDLLRAAQTLDSTLLTRVLDEAWARTSLETLIDSWLVPAMAAIGQAWIAGEIDIAGEHFVSAGVHGRLAAAYEAAGSRPGAPALVTGLPAGARHHLGALAFSVCARRQGLDVVYLGADVPEDSWLYAVRSLRPAGVAVSVPLESDVANAVTLCHLLIESKTPVSIRLGGPAAAAAAEQVGTAVTLLPPSVVASASEVAAALHAS